VTGLLRRFESAAASARRTWWTVFGLLTFVYLATVRTDALTMSADPTAVPPSAWQVAHHGTPILPTSAWPFYNPWHLWLADGHAISNRMPGLVYLAALAYRIDPWAARSNQLPASIVAVLCTAAAMATLALVLRRLITPQAALVGALIAGCATATWANGGSQLFPHGPDQLLLMIALLGIAGSRFVPAGVAFALSVLVRPPLAVVAAISGLAATWQRRSLRPALIIGALTASGVGAYLLYTHHFWHGGIDAGYTGTSMPGATAGSDSGGFVAPFEDLSLGALRHFGVNLAGCFVSPGRGVLVGSPFLILLLCGLVPAWRAAPGWVRSAAVCALVYLAIVMKAGRFSGGVYFWSYRYPLESLALAAPLLALAWREWVRPVAWRRLAFRALVGVSVTWQAVGAVAFRGPYVDHPWTFDNLQGALTGSRALAGWLVLGLGLVVTAAACRLNSAAACRVNGEVPATDQAGRRCSTSPAPIA